MVKFFRFTNYRNESLIVILNEEYPKTGLWLVDADGLGPVKAQVSRSEPVIVDGSYFNYARAQERNIVLTFRFASFPDVKEDGYPNDYIEDPRHIINGFFTLKRKLRIQVVTDRRNVFTYGYVESDDPNIWSDKEETQVSIICPEPWFTDSLQPSKKLDLTDPQGLFEFPFDSDLPWHWNGVGNPEPWVEGDDGYVNISAIPSTNYTQLYSDRPDKKNGSPRVSSGRRIIFGKHWDGDWEVEVYNPGDVEVGCFITICPKYNVTYEEFLVKPTTSLESTITIANQTSDHLPRQDQNLSKNAEWKRLSEELDSDLQIDISPFWTKEDSTDNMMHTKDAISICTIPGNRSAKYKEYYPGSGKTYNYSALFAIDSISGKWLTILPGKNWIRLAFNGEDGEESTFIPYLSVIIEFPVCYEGI